MIRASLRFACASLLAALPALPVRSTTLTWTGAVSSDFSNSGNWNPQLPTGGNDLQFGPGSRTDVAILTTAGAASIQIFGNGDQLQHPFFQFSGTSLLTLSGDVSTSLASGKFGSGISLSLSTPSTWNLASGSNLTVEGALTSSSAFAKTGDGALYLMGNTDGLTGGVTVEDGSLHIGASTAFGSGALTVKYGAALSSRSGMGSTIGSGTDVTLKDGAALGDPSGQIYSRLTFSGPVTVGSDEAATTLVLNPESQSYFEGALEVAEFDTNVTFTGGGVAILKGATAPTMPAASFTADGAGLVIDKASALPTGSLQASNNGYLGMGADFVSSTAGFLDKISDKQNFSGTLGFDSDPSGAPNTFGAGETLDLTEFTSFSGLGSASHATLAANAVLNFAGAYKFGGGGGRLTVGSNLTSAVGLSVISPSTAPLTLVLTGTNTFTGNVGVEHSYLIFDSAGALPTGRTIALDDSGYVSATPTAPTLTATVLLGKISDSTESSVVGLDSSAPASTARTITDDISLGSFSGYLGTTTFKDDGLTLSGTITGPTSGVLRLAGLNSGKLTVTSSLLSTGSITSVVVGHPDPKLGRNGTVVLSGANTYTGGTTLRRGTLILGSSAADGDSGPLGAAAGKLTVNTYDEAPPFSPAATLLPGLSAVTLFNDIFLEANSYLEIGRADQTTATLTLKGNMSGSGSLVFRGPTVAELLGKSTRTGNTRVESTTVTVAHNSGIQSTSLFLDNSTVAFSSTVSTPTIGSLGGTTGSVLSFGAANATLTINQSSDEKYSGTFTGTGVSLVKDGNASLLLAEASTLGGELKVNSGSVIFANPGIFTTNNAYIGNKPGETDPVQTFSGAVEVFTGSTWSSTGYVKVGAASSATGFLSIENNAMLQATGPVYIGYANSSEGTIEVTGVNAKLSASSLELAHGSNSQGTLRVDGGGAVSISGSVTIKQGGLIEFGSGSFSASSVSVQGGTLSVAAGQTLTFNLNSGTKTLTFDSDGAYAWQLQDNASVTLASSISVDGKLEISATSITPFHLKLATVCSGGQPGTLSNFSATAPTSWTILTTTQGITGFYPTKFSIDAGSFENSPIDSLFSISQQGNNLVLNFTPVPEPSTWVLLITGLATLTASALRRRKRA